jgi:hypothetical protein
MTSPAKVMMIAFDACAPAIATRLAAEGRAPHLVPIVDLGPTICSLLGVELEDVDGRPVTELSTPQRSAPAGSVS